MAGIKLVGRPALDVTIISNAFIDKYMALANGEYVKVYLYLLRVLESGGGEFSISKAADFFEHTEKDIMRALNYWKKEGLLILEVSATGTLTAIAFKQLEESEHRMITAETTEIYQKEQAASPLLREPVRKKAVLPKTSNSFQEDGDFAQLLYIAQKYTGKVIKPVDCDKLAYLYNDLQFSVELLEFLIEYCVSAGHTSFRYMEKVALDWHERNITTVDRARDYTASYNRESFMVMKAFGIADRHPGTVEKEMINRWFFEYKLPTTVVLEACNRTLANTKKPSFEYADKILLNWKERGVKRKEDIDALDIAHKESVKKDQKSSNRKPAANNKFHNFEQRDYDYDAMLKNLQ